MSYSYGAHRRFATGWLPILDELRMYGRIHAHAQAHSLTMPPHAHAFDNARTHTHIHLVLNGRAHTHTPISFICSPIACANVFSGTDSQALRSVGTLFSDICVLTQSAVMARFQASSLAFLREWRPNFVLLNFYPQGHHAMGYHSDNEPELGHDPVVVSISFGVRLFCTRTPSTL